MRATRCSPRLIPRSLAAVLQYDAMNGNATQPQQHTLELISDTVAQTVQIGVCLGQVLERGDIVLLDGEFGVGKTHLTKGIAQGLGADAMVNSPSFVLINQYRAGAGHKHLPIVHIDLYRLEDPAALVGIGLDDALDGHGISIIEWPELAAAVLPTDFLRVQMYHVSETSRSLSFVPHGRRAANIVEALRRTLGAGVVPAD